MSKQGPRLPPGVGAQPNTSSPRAYSTRAQGFVHNVPGERVDPALFVGRPSVLEPAKARAELPPSLSDALTDKSGPGVSTVRITNSFLSRLPSRGLTLWHRRTSVAGNTLVTGTRTYADIFRVPAGQGLVVLQMIQRWMVGGLDAGDVNVLTALQDNYDAYGRVGFNLRADQRPILDANESMLDPNTGAPITREVNGFTALNVNLLDIGNHPTALFVPESTLLQGIWSVNALVGPASPPTTVDVQLDGYLMTMRHYSDVLSETRAR